MKDSSRNRRFTRGIVFTIPLFLFLFGSCGIVLNGRYYDVRQPGEAINQTSYEFHFSRAEVMATLDSCFTYKSYGRGKKILAWKLKDFKSLIGMKKLNFAHLVDRKISIDLTFIDKKRVTTS